MNNTPLQMRPMLDDDITEVMAVELLAYDFPWAESTMRSCLKPGYSCLVCLQEHKIVGHAIMSVAADEATILNLCIHPDMQGRGFGRKLLEQMLTLARLQRAGSVFLEMRCSNGTAFDLYDAAGFNETGVRHNYYPAKKGREDAVLMAKTLRV